MGTIDSAEANKELGKIDKILSKEHLLIGGLAVKYHCPARESKDIDLVCSDEIRTKILELYPSNKWDVIDENRDEYRPDYHIKNKKTGLIISFGPKITEREPYQDIKYDKLLKDHSEIFKYSNIEFKNIYIPNAAALAYTKLLSFINRQNDKAEQDLKDFISLTNRPECSADVLFNLIDDVTDPKKLKNDFWNKIKSNQTYMDLVEEGNIFKLANFFSLNENIIDPSKELGIESYVETKKTVIHADPQSVHQYISEKELLKNSEKIDIILYTYETQATTLRADLMHLCKSILFRVLIRNPYKDKLKSNNVKSSINIMNEIMSKNHLVNFQVRFYDDPPLLRTFVFHKSENQTEGLFGMYIFENDSVHKFVGAEDNYLLHLNNYSLFEGHLLKTIQSRFEYLWSSLSCKKAVLFDLDGVVLDSMQLYVKSWQHSFNKLGINITEKEVYLREGEKSEATVQEIYMKYKGCEPDANTMNLIINEKEKYFIKNRRIACVYDGVKSLLINLKERNIKLGLVTGSKNPSAKLGNDLLFMFDAVISGEDVIRGKPDPEPYLKAIEKIGIASSNCYVIENAPLGIKSAKKANLTCFAVKNNSPLDNALLTDSGADYIYQDINHLSKHLKWADSNLELKDLIDFM